MNKVRLDQPRDQSTLDDHRYSDGDKKFVTIEGIPLSLSVTRSEIL